MNWTDPYHRLGLRCNPFRTEPIPGVPETLWVDRGFSTPPPMQSGLLLQIIGDPGAGKTSHLLHWRQQTGGGYTYYPLEWVQRWQWPASGSIAYWDEVDRMPIPLLWAGLSIAKSQNSTIVAGTHQCLKWAGKLIGLPVETIVLPSLTADELIQWSEQRIAAVRLCDNVSISLRLTDQDALAIVQQSQTSWRQAATLLHIWAAQSAGSSIC
jgi:hypothetical protein